MEKKTKKIIAIFFLCLLFFIADRLLKKLCFLNQKLLVCQENPNFLFIINNNFFVYLMILIFFGIIYLIIKNYQTKNFGTIFLLNLILLGGFSNFLDRINYGYVIDLFNFFNIFTFNLADAMIFSGSLLFLWQLLKIKKVS